VTRLHDLSDTLGLPICVLDIETSGYYDPWPAAIEIAARVVGQGEESQSIDTLLNQRVPISPFAQRVHGISRAALKGAPDFGSVAARLDWIFSSTLIVGYGSNASDLPTLRKNAQGRGLILPDTTLSLDLQRVWQRLSEQRSGRLGEVARHYGVKPGTAHRAMGDVETTTDLLLAMIDRHGLDKVILPSLRADIRRYTDEVGATRAPRNDSEPLVATGP